MNYWESVSLKNTKSNNCLCAGFPLEPPSQIEDIVLDTKRKGELTVGCGKYKCLKRSLLFHTNASSLLEKFKREQQCQHCTCQKKAQGPQEIEVGEESICKNRMCSSHQ